MFIPAVSHTVAVHGKQLWSEKHPVKTFMLVSSHLSPACILGWSQVNNTRFSGWTNIKSFLLRLVLLFAVCKVLLK